MKSVIPTLIGSFLLLSGACSPVRSFQELEEDAGEAGPGDAAGEDASNPDACVVTVTCASEGANCGLLDDGCGGELDCGTCPGGQTCGGGGTPNRCPETDSGADADEDAGPDADFDAACAAGTKACDGFQVMECGPGGTWEAGEWCSAACVDGACGCALPWGGALADGQSTTAYEHDAEMSPELCANHTEQRACQGELLTGSYPYGECLQLFRDCTLPGHGTLEHGEQVTGYDTPTVPCGSTCAQTTFSCHDGSVLGGTIFFASCAEDCSCGPYPDITLTGSTSGWVGGSNPYTHDSAFARAAVHAGLLAVGETGTIKRLSMGVMSGFTGSTQNGITTSSWSSAACGVYLSK